MSHPETQEWLSLVTGAQNQDGGVPYVPGKQSSLEATALAVVSLRLASVEKNDRALARARGFLSDRQAQPGTWTVAATDRAPAWEAPLVLLALDGVDRYRETCRAGVDALLHVQAEKANPAGVELNPRWRGWNWYPPTPGWVEPTSMALIAVQKLIGLADKRLAETRIEDGWNFLLDRMSPDGGWNYGNSYVMGRSVAPFLAPTALALLALHPIRLTDARILATVDSLATNLSLQPSGQTLSWGILALLAYGRPVEVHCEALKMAWKRSRFLDNLAVMSLAAIALESTPDSNLFSVE